MISGSQFAEQYSNYGQLNGNLEKFNEAVFKGDASVAVVVRPPEREKNIHRNHGRTETSIGLQDLATLEIVCSLICWFIVCLLPGAAIL